MNSLTLILKCILHLNLINFSSFALSLHSLNFPSTIHGETINIFRIQSEIQFPQKISP